jgi:hypothetical protein
LTPSAGGIRWLIDFQPVAVAKRGLPICRLEKTARNWHSPRIPVPI